MSIFGSIFGQSLGGGGGGGGDDGGDDQGEDAAPIFALEASPDFAFVDVLDEALDRITQQFTLD